MGKTKGTGRIVRSSRPRRFVTVDLIGRKAGRLTAFGAVKMPAGFPRVISERVAVAVYARKHPGFNWEAIAI